MDGFVDITRKITLRGGYRYEWGNASDVILPTAELVTGLEQGKIRRSVWIAGLAWRPVQNAWVNLDFEDGSSGSTYFRTSLYNYQKASARGRYRLSPAWSLSASASVLNNRDPLPGINYSFLSHQESASFQYTPAGGKVWSFEGGYTRSTVYSNINYLDPEFLIPEVSVIPGDKRPHAQRHVQSEHAKNRVVQVTGGSAFLSSSGQQSNHFLPARQSKLSDSDPKEPVMEQRVALLRLRSILLSVSGIPVTEMVTTGVSGSRR